MRMDQCQSHKVADLVVYRWLDASGAGGDGDQCDAGTGMLPVMGTAYTRLLQEL